MESNRMKTRTTSSTCSNLTGEKIFTGGKKQRTTTHMLNLKKNQILSAPPIDTSTTNTSKHLAFLGITRGTAKLIHHHSQHQPLNYILSTTLVKLDHLLQAQIQFTYQDLSLTNTSSSIHRTRLHRHTQKSTCLNSI